MAEQSRQGFCQECNKYTLVKRQGISHILHLLLTVFTLGLWLLVWVFLSIFTVGGWRCQTCGSDRIKDTGEMLSVRGWIIIAILVLLAWPVITGLLGIEGDMGSRIYVPLLAIPVLAFLSVRHHLRKDSRLANPPPEPASDPEPPLATGAQPSENPSRFADDTPAGMTVVEETVERAETDTTAADEFRRRLQRRDNQ